MGKKNPIDMHVGSRLRMRRTLLGMSQEKLGKALGLTFQQVQKYERGANRIGSSRLFKLSHILDVPVGYFFDDMGENASRSKQSNRETDPAVYDREELTKRETLELVRAYYRISNPAIRKRTFELVKSIASEFKR